MEGEWDCLGCREAVGLSGDLGEMGFPGPLRPAQTQHTTQQLVSASWPSPSLTSAPMGLVGHRLVYLDLSLILLLLCFNLRIMSSATSSPAAGVSKRMALRQRSISFLM